MATLCTFKFKSVRAHIVFQLLLCLFFPVSLWTSIFAAQQRLMNEQLSAPKACLSRILFEEKKISSMVQMNTIIMHPKLQMR
jgi:hypothetical protein